MNEQLAKLRCYLIVIAIISTVVACSVIVSCGNARIEDNINTNLGGSNEGKRTL